MCSAYTACNPRDQYVQRKGDFDHDNVCAWRTLCSVDSQRTKYEVQAAVDSPSFAVNGTDAVCRAYSSCADGMFMSFSGAWT